MTERLPRIKTSFVYPPIPIRSHDWQAYYDGDEPNDAGSMDHGEGRTEAEAVLDLIDNYPRGVQCERDAESPAKKPGCSHQFEDEPNCVPALRVNYRCTHCGTEWQDDWSCECDDDCPSCGTTMTALDSEQIAPCACEYLKD